MNSTATQSLRPILERLRRAWRASACPKFLRWWGGELRALLPSRWQSWFDGGADWYLLQCSGSEWTLRRAGTVDPLAHWDDTPDVLAGERRHPPVEFTTALRHVDHEDLRLALLLPAAAALRRAVMLPLAARDNLQQVIGFEVDRQTPFQSAQVHFAARELVAPSPSGRFQAELIVVMRNTLDPLLVRLHTAGIVIDTVDLAAGNDRLGINLLPTDRVPHRTRPRLRLNLALVGASIVLSILLLAQWLHNRQAALVQMQAEVESMRSEAQQVAALRQQLTDDAGAAGFLAQRKKNTVGALSLLQEVTARLPDSAWLERFSVDNTGRIGLQGQSLQAARLLDALKDSSLITDASFQGSIQPDPVTGKERFYLTAQVRQPTAPVSKQVPSGSGGNGR